MASEAISMKPKKRGATLKVCRTCRHWSDKHKGICTRLQRGAGQFWMCDEWLELKDNSAESQEGEEQAVQTD